MATPWLSEALLGGVASEILHGATRPVLLVRLKRNQASGEVCVLPAGGDLAAHLLFPTDFSDNADLAFTVVEQMATASARRITLLHVLDARNEPELAAIDRELKMRLTTKGSAEVEVAVRTGRPYQAIVATARETDAHLIVMGSQGRGYVSELFLGSVSHQVARHAPVPVLLVPAAR